MTAQEVAQLRDEWSTLYRETLPSLARTKDPSQSKWPVTLDHCFARIILDNTVGKDANAQGRYAQWDTVIKKPAVRNMSADQLRAAIALGHEIASGAANLLELDEISLTARGKNEKKYGTKRTAEDDQTERSAPPKKKGKQQSTIAFRQNSRTDSNDTTSTSRTEKAPNAIFPPERTAVLARIRAHDNLTDYRKRLYATLLSVPAGEFTTYQAMADFLGSSARAIGSGMRNNPFAPDVPCHRVLASDRTIGGFGGSWGKDGKNADKKVRLLQAEGVKFDSTGKARGPILSKFEDLL